MKRFSIIFAMALLSNVTYAAPKTKIETLRKQAHYSKLHCSPAVMEMKYAQILKVKPHDEDAAFHVALARSWQPEKMDQASEDFALFIKQHPNHKEAWLAYANVENWRQHLDKAFALLENYKERFGVTEEYLRTRARLLTHSGHYNQALAINTPLLTADPKDYDLAHTQTRALLKSKHYKEARMALRQLQKMECKNDDTKDLENDFVSLSESPLAFGVDYYFDNQSLKNTMYPFSFNWTINDNTHFVLRALHEVLSAGSKSGVQTIQHHSTIYDDSFMAGIEWRVTPIVAITGLAGDLKIEDLEDKFIYFFNANFALDDNVNLNISNLRNLYRPFLYPTSPKAVSMGITEYLTSANLNWQPWLYTNMNILAAYSMLSDGNQYTHIDLAPNREFILNSKMTATLGTDYELLIFSEEPHHGYYSPNHHQQFLITGGLTYSPTSPFTAVISGGVGIHEDSFSDKFEPAARAYAGLSYVARPCEFNLALDYTYMDAGHEFRAYQGLSTEAQIVVRF